MAKHLGISTAPLDATHTRDVDNGARLALGKQSPNDSLHALHRRAEVDAKHKVKVVVRELVEQRASRHASSVDEHVGRAAPLALGVGDRLVPEGGVAEVFSGWQEGRTYATEPLIKCTPCGRGSVGALTSSATTRAPSSTKSSTVALPLGVSRLRGVLAYMPDVAPVTIAILFSRRGMLLCIGDPENLPRPPLITLVGYICVGTCGVCGQETGDCQARSPGVRYHLRVIKISHLDTTPCASAVGDCCTAQATTTLLPLGMPPD